MKLYHGTSARHLDRVLKHGLQPRGKKSGNWKHTVESRPDAVYLTTAYPLYYGFCATKGPKDRDALILQIDSDKLNPWALHPDEDFLGHAVKDKLLDGMSLNERTAIHRDNLEAYQEHWPASVEALGNCCHIGGIPLDAITQAVVVPNIAGWVAYSDPVIAPLNYRFMGPFYRELTASLFGETNNETFEMGRMPPPEVMATVRKVKMKEEERV